MKKFLLSLDEKMHQDLKIKAIEKGISMNDLIAKAIQKVLKENK
jgi:predicted HicB family RNase H-like nuclease